MAAPLNDATPSLISTVTKPQKPQLVLYLPLPRNNNAHILSFSTGCFDTTNIVTKFNFVIIIFLIIIIFIAASFQG